MASVPAVRSPDRGFPAGSSSIHMAYEIDFLAVGDTKSGDAICLRYGSITLGYKIHVVDGGFQDCGDKVVSHVWSYYGQPWHIDHVVLTHADNDHAGGLIKVLEAYSVGCLWMNRPWVHADEIVDLFKYGWTVDGLRKKLRDLYPTLVRLEEVATQKNIPIRDTFQGEVIGDFVVLAPSRQRYLSLIPQFDKTPAPRTEAQSVFERLFKAVTQLITETWTGETLSENPEATSASNESSVVQFGILDTHPVLLTGDVGPQGLKEAADYIESKGFALPRLEFVQVPHHGSRRNVTPSILNRWLGPPLASDTVPRRGVAFCSAAHNDEDHPRKKVVNAFLRRGYPVHTTNGQHNFHFKGTPARQGWGASIPLPFSFEVEE